MAAPGETLLIKLWETIFDKGIGSLLKPWQMRREGLASIEIRRAEMLALAHVEVEVEKIKKETHKHTIELLAAPIPQTSFQISHAPVSLDDIKVVVDNNIRTEAARKEIALAKAVLHAEDELKNDSSPAPDANVSDDWLLRWRDYAAGVSSDELQSIWGKVLAGEVKAPGRYSLRTLEFLRNLNQDDAKLIEKIAAHQLTNLIFSESQEELQVAGLSFTELLNLQDIGVISGVDGLGLTYTGASSSDANFILALTSGTKVMQITADDAQKQLKLRAVAFTNIGKQLMQLIGVEPSEDSLLAVSIQIKAQGFDVHLGKYTRVNQTQIQMFDLRPL